MNPENQKPPPPERTGERIQSPPKVERPVALDAAARALLEACPDIAKEFSEQDVARHLDDLVVRLRTIIREHRL